MTIIRLAELRVDGNPRLPGGGSAPSAFVVKKAVPNSLFAQGEVDAIEHHVETGWIHIHKGSRVRLVRVERVSEAEPALDEGKPAWVPPVATQASTKLLDMPDIAAEPLAGPIPGLDASGGMVNPNPPKGRGRTLSPEHLAKLAEGRARAKAAKEPPSPVVGAPPMPPTAANREAALAEREAMQVKAAGG